MQSRRAFFPSLVAFFSMPLLRLPKGRPAPLEETFVDTRWEAERRIIGVAIASRPLRLHILNHVHYYIFADLRLYTCYKVLSHLEYWHGGCPQEGKEVIPLMLAHEDGGCAISSYNGPEHAKYLHMVLTAAYPLPTTEEIDSMERRLRRSGHV